MTDGLARISEPEEWHGEGESGQEQRNQAETANHNSVGAEATRLEPTLKGGADEEARKGGQRTSKPQTLEPIGEARDKEADKQTANLREQNCNGKSTNGLKISPGILKPELGLSHIVTAASARVSDVPGSTTIVQDMS